nr:MlcW [uncultured bacterium]
MALQRACNRRERPATPVLTRDGTVATAVSVMGADGLERVPMRRLAGELDTGPASLDVYVKDTDESHGEILDAPLDEVDLKTAPDSGAGDWRERLWTVLGRYREVLVANPNLAKVALVTRLNGPNHLAVTETGPALPAEGGVPPGQAEWAADVLLLVFTATAVEAGTRKGMPGATEEHDALVNTVLAASARTHPHIAALGADLVSGPGTARARWAIDLVLDRILSAPCQ